MGRVIDNTPHLLSSRISGATGVGKISYDPTGTEASRSLQRDKPAVIEQGIVLRAGPGGYDCTVKIGQYEVPCNVVISQTTQGFGITKGELPIEGTCVFVLLQRGSYACGWIMGSIPRARHLNPNDEEDIDLYENYPTHDEENPYEDNIAYKLIHQGKENTFRLWSNAERPQDIMPGEFLLINENNCGMTTTMYDVSLSGGASYVRVGRLDDEIRMRSTSFQKWTNQEYDYEFNDGGHISAEGRFYSYQGELLGLEGHEGPHYERPQDTDEKEPRPRVRWWKSFLGNLLSYFVVRARRSKDDFDTTLASLHVSQAGNVIVKAGGGVSLERYERIPTPKRLKDPWDPQGDREKDCPHEAIQPFKVEVPHDRGLAAASKQAWEVKSQYKRWDELKKDFKVQNEDEVKLPQDDDEDPKHSKEIRYSEYRDRHAGIFVGDDGSIILRDTWGSEIVMLGGNILINTPGNVIHTANRDIVSIAKQSVVIRGTEAAEVSSEEGDTRIHAKKLVTVAGGTDDDPGGVLIESLADGSYVNAPEKAGRNAEICGVVVRSEKAGVSVSGKATYVTGEEAVFLTSGPSGGTRDGSICIDGGEVIITGKDQVANIVEETCVIVSKKSAFMACPESSFVWGGSAMIMNGDKVPILWDSAGEPPDLSDIKDTWTKLQDSKVIEPFDWDTLKEQALFSFRTDFQAHTNAGIEPWKPNGPFTLYEPWWQVMKDYGDRMIEKAEPYHPDAKEVHKSKCWPCVTAIDSGVFKKCPKPVNLDNWWSKPREGLSDSETIVPESMSEFKV